MPDEGLLAEQRDRGARAKAILGDSLTVDAFNDIVEAIMAAWDNTDPQDKDRREDCWRLKKLSANFKQAFTTHVETGTFAVADLFDIEEKKTRLRDRFTRNAA